MKTRLAIALALGVLALSAFALGYAGSMLQRAARIRVAACQMLPDRKAWDDFECSQAFREAQ